MLYFRILHIRTNHNCIIKYVNVSLKSNAMHHWDLIIFHFIFKKLQATPDHTKKRKGGRRPAPKKDKDVKASASAEESDEEEEQEDCSAKPKCLKPVGKEVHIFYVFRTIVKGA